MLLNLQLLRQSDNDLCQRLLNARPELLRQNQADVELETMNRSLAHELVVWLEGVHVRKGHSGVGRELPFD
jgi:hypothetical protein